jgi:hypothetical protein
MPITGQMTNMSNELISSKRNYSAVCISCDFVGSGLSFRPTVDRGEEHLKKHPDHDVKLVTYEVKEVIIAEQFLR